MTVTPFCEPALASSRIAVTCDLVHGAEDRFIASLLPCVERRSLTLDLSAVERMDAAGISALISLYCSAVRAGTQFSVSSPNAHVLEMLRLVGLEQILLANGSRKADSLSPNSLSPYRCPAA